MTLLLSWSSLALAAPGTIKRATDARTAPFKVAPLVEAIPTGTKVQADDAVTDGWRRVQLPSGKFGYVPEEDVDLSQGAPVQPLPAGTAAAGAPAVRAPLYVGDFSHLAELVRSDDRVFDRASTLAARQTAGAVSAVGGVLVGALMIVLADNVFRSKTCVGGNCVKGTNLALHNSGLGLLFFGPVLGWALSPTGADRAAVIDEWNTRHPDRPFIDHAGVEAPR